MTFSRYTISALVLALASACGSDAEAARELAPDDAAGWQVEPDADVVLGDASRDSSATHPDASEFVDAAPADATTGVDAESELDAESAEAAASEPAPDSGDVDAAAYTDAKVLWSYGRRETRYLGQTATHELARAEIFVDLRDTFADCRHEVRTGWYAISAVESVSVYEIGDASVECLRTQGACQVPLSIRWAVANHPDDSTLYPGPGGYDVYRPGCDGTDIAGNRLAWRHTVHQLDADAVDETWELIDLAPTP